MLQNTRTVFTFNKNEKHQVDSFKKKKNATEGWNILQTSILSGARKLSDLAPGVGQIDGGGNMGGYMNGEPLGGGHPGSKDQVEFLGLLPR